MSIRYLLELLFHEAIRQDILPPLQPVVRRAKGKGKQAATGKPETKGPDDKPWSMTAANYELQRLLGDEKDGPERLKKLRLPPSFRLPNIQGDISYGYLSHNIHLPVGTAIYVGSLDPPETREAFSKLTDRFGMRGFEVVDEAAAAAFAFGDG